MAWWTNERALYLIASFKQHECLWRQQDKNYKNIKLKQAIKQRIAAELGTTMAEVNNKWKNLLSHFHRENWKEKYQPDFCSRWYATKPMQFLNENYEQNPPVNINDLRLKPKLEHKKRIRRKHLTEDEVLVGHILVAKLRRMDAATKAEVIHRIHKVFFNSEMRVLRKKSKLKQDK